MLPPLVTQAGHTDLKAFENLIQCQTALITVNGPLFISYILIDIVPGLRYDPQTSILCQLVISAVFHFVTLVSTFRGTRSCTKSPGDHSDNSFIMSQTPALQPS